MPHPEGSNASSRMDRHVEKGGQGFKDRKHESIAMRVRRKEHLNNYKLLLTNLMVSLVVVRKSPVVVARLMLLLNVLEF